MFRMLKKINNNDDVKMKILSIKVFQYLQSTVYID